CGCKHTRDQPFCDGAHTNLPGGSPLDDPASPENLRVPVVEERDGARVSLNGRCYVFSPARAALSARGALRYCMMVSAEQGSEYQTQLFLRLAGAESPVLTLGAREVILFVARGSGTATISGKSFALAATDGVYLRPGEALRLAAPPGVTLEVFLLSCPQAQPEWLADMPTNFD